MLAAAWAHARAAARCFSNPDANHPSTDAIFFRGVSFELHLLSVEQSLKLMLYLRHQSFRSKHDLHPLYSRVSGIQSESTGRSLIGEIVYYMNLMGRGNLLGRQKQYSEVTEEELECFVKMHNTSYIDFRYFGVNRSMEPIPQVISAREFQIIQLLSIALVGSNLLGLEDCGIQVQWHFSKEGGSYTAKELTDFLAEVRQSILRKEDEANLDAWPTGLSHMYPIDAGS